MREFRFVKLSGKWFVDIPWDGDINDLQMVSGADTLLDCHNADGSGIVTCKLLEADDKPRNGWCITYFKKISETEYGATYSVEDEYYRSEVWLCPVLKHVLGEYPDSFEVEF